MFFTTAMVNALLYPGRCIYCDSVFHQNISNQHMPLLGHEMERSQATLQTEEVSAQWQCHHCSSTSRDSKSGLQPGKLTDMVLLATAARMQGGARAWTATLSATAGVLTSSLAGRAGTAYLAA